MWLGVVSVFPEMFSALTGFGVTGRAFRQQQLSLHCFNPRDYGESVSRRVDDRPYGGGPGMVMQIDPLRKCIQAARQQAVDAGFIDVPVHGLSPQGQPVKQAAIQELATLPAIIFLCGRYEGIDERLLQLEVDQEWSVGDFVVSGGELPAMMLMDALIRLQPGVLGCGLSAAQDSFAGEGLLDCPHYTRPPVYAGQSVPEVLLSGDHQAIADWRYQQQLQRTAERRPDLWQQWLLRASDKVRIKYSGENIAGNE